MTRNTFTRGKFLIPKTDLYRWSVIACDQYTSQPAYWEEAERIVGDAPSSLRCVFPEVYLSRENTEEIRKIHNTMESYLGSDLFSEYKNSYIYIERTLSSGKVRKGIIGCIDLEDYDYHEDTYAPIRATEKTVTERLPSRIAIREEAPLELTHVIMLCDDAEKQLIETTDTTSLPLMYDFDLMQNGGHLKGWLIAGKDADEFDQKLNRYYESRKTHKILFAVGDGNHSVAAAREVYLQLKKDHPEIDYSNRPERYAMVELENIHDPIQEFEPIHRIFRQVDPGHLLEKLQEVYGSEDGEPLKWVCGNQSGIINVDISRTGYLLGSLQRFLDTYTERYGGETDYIHGEENIASLTGENTIGFILPALKNSSFFQTIEENGVYVRKSFSIGEADDKRFYLEARIIKQL